MGQLLKNTLSPGADSFAKLLWSKKYARAYREDDRHGEHKEMPPEGLGGAPGGKGAGNVKLKDGQGLGESLEVTWEVSVRLSADLG